ncbi:hypothetical protein Nepgr_005295 [Nepenthes gracilis]|uniref:Uncharacterized protein n=1 Tax=Nepenthes gracilis TaxID=150966 RepID=A0AAD3S3D6_NEPGR|nr:hypothetical protein Nepgr_005295 [Nepenthes gracilis]
MLMLHGLLLGQDSDFILAGSLCWAMLRSNAADAALNLAVAVVYSLDDHVCSLPRLVSASVGAVLLATGKHSLFYTPLLMVVAAESLRCSG